MAASSSSHAPVSGSSYRLPPLEIHDNVLYLLGTKGVSKTYHIAIRNFVEGSPAPQGFVPVNGVISSKDSISYANVTELKKKLNLSKSKVREIAGRDNAIDLFRRAAAIHRFITTSKIEQKYKTKLSEKYLHSEIKSFKIKKKVFLLGILLGSIKIRYFFDTHEFKLYRSELIGVGNYSKVYKIFTLIGPDSGPLALKKVKFKSQNNVCILDRSIPDLKNETEVLKKIHSSRKLPGIQAPPIFTAKLAYTTPLYDSNLLAIIGLKKFRGMNSKEKLKLMGLLIVGLASLHQSGYFHGDIKLENCLVKIDTSSAKPKICNVVLSDFGGAKEVNVWKVTPTRVPYSLHYLAPELVNGAEVVQDLTKYTAEQLQSNDVFALSKTILEALTYEKIEGIISDEQFQRLTQNERIPVRLAKVLRDRMREPIERGLTAAQFLSDFSAAFREVYDEDFLI